MLRYLSRFLYILQGKHRNLLILAILFIVVSSLEAIGIGLVGPFIQLATTPNLSQGSWASSIYNQLGFTSEMNFLLLFGFLVIAIFFVKSFLTFTVQKYIFDFGFNYQGELCSKLMSAYLAAPYTFHLGRNTATLIQNIVNETDRFCNGVMMPLLVSTSNLVITLAISILLVKTDAVASLLISGIVLVAYVIVQSFKDKMSRWGKEGSEAVTEMIRTINHGLGGLKESRIIGCESYFEDHMREQAKKFARSTTLAVSFSTLPRYVIEALLITFLIGFTFIYLSINRSNPQNLSAVLGVFGMASIRLLPAVSNLMSSINSIRFNSYALDKLYFDIKELNDLKLNAVSKYSVGSKSVSSLESGKRQLSLSSKIVLDKVVYRYPNVSENALNEISLSIKKGQSIGLIGRSGAGKTTLVDVILGLLTPEAGDIQVDGVSIYSDIRAWQNMIGYVPQSIFLTDDTLERNIAFGVPDHYIDSKRLKAAIEAAQLAELVEQLPEGIHTVLGERGVRLSGGQRQRIGIARALYHEREVLVLDEATAALDNETERLVSSAIESLGGTKTVIIIAHRLSTIEHCDCIYLLEKGRVARSGSYQEVVSV